MKTSQKFSTVALVAILAAPGVFAQNGQDKGKGKDQQDDKDRRARQVETRFRGMDQDSDGVITRAEWRGNDQSFRQHDTNHDNVLSGEEVRAAVRTAQERAAIRATGPTPGTPAVEARRRDDLIARFTRADRDNDDRIARGEWLGTAEAFTRMDRNGDSFVTREEFMAEATNRTPAGAADRRDTPAYKAGYDKGIVEGRQAGKDDKTVNGGKWDLEGQRELEQADSGYQSSLGTREDYQAGYRAGFRLGYREGFGPR
jgi:EF hand domain-containing protein